MWIHQCKISWNTIKFWSSGYHSIYNILNVNIYVYNTIINIHYTHGHSCHGPGKFSIPAPNSWPLSLHVSNNSESYLKLSPNSRQLTSRACMHFSGPIVKLRTTSHVYSYNNHQWMNIHMPPTSLKYLQNSTKGEDWDLYLHLLLYSIVSLVPRPLQRLSLGSTKFTQKFVLPSKNKLVRLV